MNWLHDLVARYLSSPGVRAYRECRHCGTTLETLPKSCPACDSTEFATYSLS